MATASRTLAQPPPVRRANMRHLPRAQCAELEASFERQGWSVTGAHDDDADDDELEVTSAAASHDHPACLLVLPSLDLDSVSAALADFQRFGAAAADRSRAAVVVGVELLRRNAHRLDAFAARYRRRLRRVVLSATQVAHKVSFGVSVLVLVDKNSEFMLPACLWMIAHISSRCPTMPQTTVVRAGRMPVDHRVARRLIQRRLHVGRHASDCRQRTDGRYAEGESSARHESAGACPCALLPTAQHRTRS
jgi:hypothetical protein